MKKTRLLEFDILRCFAFLFIVIQHTFGGFSGRNDISWTGFLISKFLYQLSDLGTPAFVFLTGVVLYYSYKDNLNIKEFYIKKIKFLVLPYVFISIVVLLLQKKPIDKDLIWILLCGDAQYHLWYMAMIIRVYLYFPLVYLLMKLINKQNKYIIALCFPLIFYICNFVINPYKIMPYIESLLFSNPGKLQEGFINVSPIFYISNFILGIYIINHFDLFKKIIFKFKYLIFAVYAFFFAQTFYLMLCEHFKISSNYLVSNSIRYAFYKPCGILCLYLISYYINDKFQILSKLMIFISKYSFPAYMIHAIILNALTGILATSNKIISPTKFWFLGAFFSIMISFILSYLPFSKYLIGCKTKINNLNISDLKKYYTKM